MDAPEVHLNTLHGQPRSPAAVIMTYNIHSGVGVDGRYDLERIARTITDAGADIVFLQEVERNTEPCTSRKWSTNHDDDQAEKLAELTGMHASFFPALQCEHRGGRTVRHEGKSFFGIAMLSRTRPLEQLELRFSPYGQTTPRNASAVRLMMPWGGVWAVGVHACCMLTGQAQRVQTRELTAWLEELPKRTASDGSVDDVIIGGDFNAPPWFAASQWMRQAGRAHTYQDLWREHGHGTGCTTCKVGCMPPLLRVDYLFLEQGSRLQCESILTVPSNGSDHDALVARLALAEA